MKHILTKHVDLKNMFIRDFSLRNLEGILTWELGDLVCH